LKRSSYACEILASHDGAVEDSGLLGCYNVSTGKSVDYLEECIAFIFLLKDMDCLPLKMKLLFSSETS
jgi:hypothetical protein